MKLIIQVPCYNEEKTLELAYNDLPRHIDGIDTIEYLIINDGSKDKTVQRARELGFHHVVSFRRNKGLARGFMAGLDACLRLGADIIVNTDADNQYRGEDIEKLVRPILERKADMVIGERPIDETEHFSWKKKKFQHLGSWVVRVASNTDVPDAPSGFRTYSRASFTFRANRETDFVMIRSICLCSHILIIRWNSTLFSAFIPLSPSSANISTSSHESLLFISLVYALICVAYELS